MQNIKNIKKLKTFHTVISSFVLEHKKQQRALDIRLFSEEANTTLALFKVSIIQSPHKDLTNHSD